VPREGLILGTAMSFAASLLTSVTTLGIASVASVFVRVGSRRRRRRAPAPTGADKDPSAGPSLTARLGSLRYPGPIGPKTCLEITNVGISPVHDVVVVVAASDDPEPTDAAVVLWSQPAQNVTSSVALGTIWPHEPALIPALLPPGMQRCGLVVNCRTDATSWEFGLDVSL
jgi:hypothetical protein